MNTEKNYYMKKLEIFKRIRFRDRVFIIYILGGIIPFIFSSYYSNIQNRESMINLSRETQKEELSLMKDRIKESMAIVEKVSTQLFINSTVREIVRKDYKTIEEFEDDCSQLSFIDSYLDNYEQDISDITIYVRKKPAYNKYFSFIGKTTVSQEWYKPTCNRGGKIYWSYGYDKEKKEKRLQLTRQIRDEYGNTLCILAIQVQNSKIKKFISERSVNTVLLFNDEDVLYTNFAINSDWDFLFKILQKNRYVSESMIVSEGIIDYIVTFDKIYQMDTGRYYSLVSIQNYRDIVSEMDQDNLRSYIAMFISIVISILLITIFSSAYGKRVDLLSKQMHLVAIGEYDKVMPIDGNDEIAKIYKELEKMIVDNRALMERVVERQVQQEKLHTKQKEVEFKMLASQINPHFLYNTLETIRMKALVNKQFEIAELVKMLAKIMRRNIQVSEKMVTFKSEIEFIEYYLKIQSFRFGDRISSEVIIADDIDMNAKILPLIIQPFVENAFVHGLEQIESGGKLTVSVEREVEIVKITIEDNGEGMNYYQLGKIRHILNNSNEIEDKTHIGISNVNQRIKMQYGETYGVKIYSEEEKGTKVVISVPYYWGDI